jgi:hypothetical protein
MTIAENVSMTWRSLRLGRGNNGHQNFQTTYTHRRPSSLVAAATNARITISSAIALAVGSDKVAMDTP